MNIDNFSCLALISSLGKKPLSLFVCTILIPIKLSFNLKNLCSLAQFYNEYTLYREQKNHKCLKYFGFFSNRHNLQLYKNSHLHVAYRPPWRRIFINVVWLPKSGNRVRTFCFAQVQQIFIYTTRYKEASSKPRNTCQVSFRLEPRDWYHCFSPELLNLLGNSFKCKNNIYVSSWNSNHLLLEYHSCVCMCVYIPPPKNILKMKMYSLQPKQLQLL